MMSERADGSETPHARPALGGSGELPGVGGLGPGFEGGESVIPPLPTEGERPAGVPAQTTMTLRRSLTYASGNFGSGVFYAFNNFILPLFLNALGAPIILNGLLSASHSVEGAVLQPLVGAWSDRTWTQRLGRRRVFIARFVPLSALFLFLTPLAPQLADLPFIAAMRSSLGFSRAGFILTLVSIGIFLFSVTFNIMYDPYNALLADITPERQRGRVNGVFQAVGALGQAAVLLTAAELGAPMTLLFLIAGATLLISFLPTVFGIREPRELPGLNRTHRYTVRDYWNGLRADRQIQLYFAVQFFLWFGINAITPFLTLFATKEAHFSDSGALVLSFILLLSSALFNWPFGVLCDRIGLKRVFLLGMMLMAGASILGIFIRDPLLLYIILTVAGIGNAAQTASSYPLLTRLVFPDQMGLYTGLNSTVTSIASPASVALTGLLIQLFGFNAMFPFVAAMFLASLVPLSLLRIDRSLVARARQAQAAVHTA